MKKKVFKALLGLIATMTLSGCVVALPVTEDEIHTADEKLGLSGDLSLSGFFEDAFDSKSPTDSVTQTSVDGDFDYSIHIMSNEEREEVAVMNNEDDTFTYGNDQIGYLTLSNNYKNSDNAYTYRATSSNSSTKVSIDGFGTVEDLDFWVDFIKESLNDRGLSVIKTEDIENGKILYLEPAQDTYWRIYVTYNADKKRVYMTNIVTISNYKTPDEEHFDNLYKNRFFDLPATEDEEL